MTGVGSWADRELTEAEVLSVLETLTARPAPMWISQGTLMARQLEYTAESGLVAESIETARVDRACFWRQKVLVSHNASEPLSKEGPQPGLDRETLRLNKTRIFAWDGRRFTQYFPGVDHAIIREEGPPPSSRRGVLTAGLLPWGEGRWALKVLAAANPRIWEVKEADGPAVRLQFDLAPSLAAVLMLDPGRAHAVREYGVWKDGKQVLNQTCRDFVGVADRWIPRAITIQRYDVAADPPMLVSYEEWRITSIDTTPPATEQMQVTFEPATLVRHTVASVNQTVWYDHNPQSDMERLLAEKLAQVQAASEGPVSCAALAARHVLDAYDRTVDDSLLASLTPAAERGTRLLTLREAIKASNLQALAVRTDAKNLRAATGCLAVLHLSESSHYVVLEALDEDCAWIFDPAGRHFFYRRSLDEFTWQWGDGIALLVSDRPLEDKWLSQAISDATADGIEGSEEGGFGHFDCTDLVQAFEVVPCSDPYGGPGGLCQGRYWQFDEVWGCQESTGSTTCSGSSVPRGSYAPCLNDPLDFTTCATGDMFLLRPIRGCLSW